MDSRHSVNTVLPSILGLLGASVFQLVLTQTLLAQKNEATGPPSSAAATQEGNRDIAPPKVTKGQPNDYRIGSQDLIDIAVFEAPELNRSVRVSTNGEISLPLLGSIHAAGRSPKELELFLEDALRKSFMNDPHVSVYVREMESHPVSVFGAVRKPGVFEIADPKSLLEVLSMAEGLADDAGNTVIVIRGAELATGTPQMATQDDKSPQAEAGKSVRNSVQLKLKDLLTSKNSSSNILVYPGDIIKVTRAGIVYVIGDVKKPGGFVLHDNEDISVLQALALAEGITPTSAKSRARIIRTDQNSQRTEISVDLGRVMNGKAPDPMLQPKDIIFVPQSGSKTALHRTAEAIISTVPAAAIYAKY